MCQQGFPVSHLGNQQGLGVPNGVTGSHFINQQGSSVSNVHQQVQTVAVAPIAHAAAANENDSSMANKSNWTKRTPEQNRKTHSNREWRKALNKKYRPPKKAQPAKRTIKQKFEEKNKEKMLVAKSPSTMSFVPPSGTPKKMPAVPSVLPAPAAGPSPLVPPSGTPKKMPAVPVVLQTTPPPPPSTFLTIDGIPISEKGIAYCLKNHGATYDRLKHLREKEVLRIENLARNEAAQDILKVGIENNRAIIRHIEISAEISKIEAEKSKIEAEKSLIKEQKELLHAETLSAIRANDEERARKAQPDPDFQLIRNLFCDSDL